MNFKKLDDAIKKKCDAIYKRIRYLISLKVASHIFLSLLSKNQS